MKQRTSILLFGLGIFLGMLVLTGSTAQPAQAASTYQDNPCAGLTPEKIRAGGVTVLQCKLHCQGILPAGDPNTWSDDELWSCINQSSAQPGDQPVEEVPPTTPPDQPDLNSACVGVTPEDFRSDSQEVTECRLLCSEADWQSDEELWACIEYYGGQRNDPPGEQPGDEPVEDVPPITPADETDTGEPASLGPLATTPLVPLAGALIGTLVGWLVSVAATSGNVLKTLVVPPPAPPTATPAGPNPAGAPVSQAALPPIEVQPPAKPANAPKSGSEHLWDIATNLAGSSAAVTSSLSEYFDFQEDAKTFQKTRDSLQAWKKNPTKEAADAYSKNLRSMTNQNAMLAKAAKVLGNAANVLDGADAVIKGMKKASERGYVGTDYALAVGAEISKKALNYALTKNPVAGLFNAAVGGYSEMVYGKDSRIDLSSIIDKGADAWDKTTQEYAANTGGDWIAPKNENFGDVLANDAELRRKDQYLHAVRKIKKLVDEGKISVQEGGARIRHLRDTLLGGE